MIILITKYIKFNSVLYNNLFIKLIMDNQIANLVILTELYGIIK